MWSEIFLQFYDKFTDGAREKNIKKETADGVAVRLETSRSDTEETGVKGDSGKHCWRDGGETGERNMTCFTTDMSRLRSDER